MGKTLEKSMCLSEWIQVNSIKDEMLWKGCAGHQFDVMFLFQKALGLREEPEVIAVHTSKSIELPVVKYNFNQDGTVFVVMRHNFHDWNVAVQAYSPITLPENKLLISGDRCWFEGFPSQYKFDPYHKDENNWKFSVCTEEIGALALLFLAERNFSDGLLVAKRRADAESCGFHI